MGVQIAAIDLDRCAETGNFVVSVRLGPMNSTRIASIAPSPVEAIKTAVKDVVFYMEQKNEIFKEI